MTNRLAQTTSTYLLQHADNPVDWYPWSEEAWQRAKREDKPVLVSIGYSSCHWCHVMEHESFADPGTAALMNERLVCIKVDREERPDVDQIYMDAVVQLTGQGGWPLNAFCTPAGLPFFAGTYFPPERAYGRPSWREIVSAIDQAYTEKRDEVVQQAEQIIEALQKRLEFPPEQRAGSRELAAFVNELMQRADTQFGGFGSAPKFPTATNLEALLLAENLRVSASGALDHLLETLKRIARGGIYDQLGGGFHRYSTDARWLVPHFEKMLYDQGQLLRVYAEALRMSPDTDLLWPIEETIAYLEREMRSEQGGFFASQDADSEGEEGKFYVWNIPEIEAVLDKQEALDFCEAYNVTPHGTFEQSGSSVLEHALAGDRPRFAAARARLLAERSERIAPATDRKQIASWIAYAASGMATAAGHLDRPEWLRSAERAVDFLLEEMRGPDRSMLRIHDGTQARVAAFLDDYAALLGALLDLTRAGSDLRYLEAAIETADALVKRFYDPERRDLFFCAADDTTLAYRPKSDSDGATPGAAGLAALGLVRCAELTGRDDLRAVAQDIIDAQSALAQRAPAATPTLLRAAALLEQGLGLGLILYPQNAEAARELASAARGLLGAEDLVLCVDPKAPPGWLAPSWLEGRDCKNAVATAYICRGHACSLPATEPDQLRLP